MSGHTRPGCPRARRRSQQTRRPVSGCQRLSGAGAAAMRWCSDRRHGGYLGTLPGVAALPLVPQSTPPLGVGRAELQAVPASAFLPEFPV